MDINLESKWNAEDIVEMISDVVAMRLHPLLKNKPEQCTKLLNALQTDDQALALWVVAHPDEGTMLLAAADSLEWLLEDQEVAAYVLAKALVQILVK